MNCTSCVQFTIVSLRFDNKERSLTDLMDKEMEMTRHIKLLDSDMQTLVYENYNKFISATDTIRKVCNKNCVIMLWVYLNFTVTNSSKNVLILLQCIVQTEYAVLVNGKRSYLFRSIPDED